MIVKSHKYVKVEVKDYSDRGVSLSNLPTEKLVSDLLNFWPNDVLIVTVCMLLLHNVYNAAFYWTVQPSCCHSYEDDNFYRKLAQVAPG